MLMLGALCKATGVVSREALEKAITDAVPTGKEQLNLEAFSMGFDSVQEVAESG
jgi:2-oxoglutarate ferredoxin oxidoreductase subunit gamma